MSEPKRSGDAERERVRVKYQQWLAEYERRMRAQDQLHEERARDFARHRRAQTINLALVLVGVALLLSVAIAEACR